MNWIRSTCEDGTVVLARAGALGGPGYTSERAHEVKNGWNYNGSGKTAFGGAEKWPVVTVSVSFPEGEDCLAAWFAEEARTFVDKFLSKNGG